jgi:hypothetical protein
MGSMLKLSPFQENVFSQKTDLKCLVAFNHQIHLEFLCLSPLIDEIKDSPLIQNPTFTKDLWKTTCFELFLGSQKSTEYWEWNFSLSGNWACYHFNNYRSGQSEHPELGPTSFEIQHKPGRMHLQISLPIPPMQQDDFIFSPTAVIETKSGSIGFWAFQHKDSHPNFHLKESFIKWENQ